ncbi:MAG: hypothetical protein JXB49_11235 [Bacteroidales bacterium]|nr:hypothetical protein [Bacteroidales bacterium]
MSKNPDKTCKECGKKTDTLYSDWYCYDCYAVIWDSGFETTSQWGESVAHSDAMKDIDDDCYGHIDEMKQSINYVLANFEPGEWRCKQCGCVRLSIEEQKTANRNSMVAALIQACPDCGRVGFLEHDLVH